jgi:hypothetical protein
VITDPAEVDWFESKFSGGDENCVEVAFLAGGGIGIRDSKNPGGLALVVDPAAWDSFLASVTRR